MPPPSVILEYTWLTPATEGEQLYSGLKTIVAEYLDRLAEERIVPAFPRASGTAGTSALGSGAEAVERAVEGDRFLRAVKSVWDDHVGAMLKIKDILRYLVRTCDNRPPTIVLTPVSYAG